MKNDFTIKAPGKLMVAGEFAVLEPYHKLVVTAVNRFVYATIRDSEQNEVSLTDFNLHHLLWKWQNNEIHFNHDDGRIPFVKNALETTYRYIIEKEVPVYPVAISIRSELDDPSGIKYGLGSSAAVVTAVVRAILTRFLPQQPEDDLIFKLASIAHVRTQGNGSGADIAASTYQGVLEYTSFQAEWLLNEWERRESVVQLVEKEWTYLSIQRVALPSSVKMVVAWTGKAASTKNLVTEIKRLNKHNPSAYTSFLEKSKAALALILQGMKQDNLDVFFLGIRQNRVALAALGEAAKVDIETDKLYTLAMEAEKVHGAGKLSGAGGGDCGIAFITTTNEELEATLKKNWQQHDIIALDLTMYE